MEKSELPIKNKKSVFLGHTEINGKMEKVYIQEKDRLRHIQSFGRSGSGKSTLMKNVIMQDIEIGNGVFVLDIYGSLIKDILSNIPEHRKNDVIYFDLGSTEASSTLSLNLLDITQNKTQTIDLLFRIFDQLHDLEKTGGPMFDMYMKNSIKLVLAHPESGCTLVDVCKVLTDRDFRRYKLAFCDDIDVTNFWDQALKTDGEANLENMIPYLTSKLDPFVSDKLPKLIFGQQKSNIDFRECMNNNKIVLICLNKQLTGEKLCHLLGLTIIEFVLSAGLSRELEDLTYKNQAPFFVYLDQINNFLNTSLAKAVEELSLHKVGLYLTHNFLGQLITHNSNQVKESLVSNCGTKFIYECSSDDAKTLESEFEKINLTKLDKYTANTVLLVNGQKTQGFNLKVSAPSKNMDDQKPKLWKNSKTATN